jgi:hypothetical protein
MAASFSLAGQDKKQWDFLDNNGVFYTRGKFVEKYNIQRICYMKYNKYYL